MPSFSMNSIGNLAAMQPPQQIPMTPAQVAEYTALLRNPRTQPVDLERWSGAHGYSVSNAKDILSFVRQNPHATLSTHFQMVGQSPSSPQQPNGPGLPTRLMGSFNEGRVGTLGQPVDLVNSGLKKLGLPASQRPIGGSEWISSQMHGLGLGAVNQSYAPQSTAEGYGQTMINGLGQAAFEPFGYGKTIARAFEERAVSRRPTLRQPY